MQHTTTLGGTSIVSKSLCFGDNLDMLLFFLSNPSRRVFSKPLHCRCRTILNGWYHGNNLVKGTLPTFVR
jgi:hypothetical protein